jgi:hypothetical protein
LAGTDTTGADGSFQLSEAPPATTAYRASFAGSDDYGTADSGQVTVGVRTRVTARKSTGTVRLGGSFTVTGTVSPNHAGQRVYLQRLVGGAWKTAATADLSSGSGFALRAKPPTRGRLTYRAYKGADGDHVAAASANQAVTVT